MKIVSDNTNKKLMIRFETISLVVAKINQNP